MSLIAENSMQIDVNNSSINNAVAVQGDHIGRKIKITLLSQGEIVDLTNCTATVKCSANGKTIAVNSCSINANVITVELTKTMLAYAGKIKMQVSVTDSKGALISTPVIYLIVSESISTTPVEQTPDFSILADLTGRIMAVLNDPAVGDMEVKDARGGYAVLGDRLNSIDTLAAFPNQTYNLIQNHTDFLNASGWNVVNAGTLSAESSLLTAVSDSNLRIYANLEKPVSLNANASVLVKIRARCVSDGTATVKPCWRAGTAGVVIDKSYIVAGNVNTADMTWTLRSAFSDLWFIAKDDTAQATIDRVGILISTGATVEVANFECYYSQDSGLTNGELDELMSDVLQDKVDISNLQATVNGSADTTGTIKNQIAAAKAEIIESNVNPLAARVAVAENNISDLQAYAGYTNDDIFGLQVDYENKTFTRLAGAVGKSAGADFDSYPMYGGRKRCNVADDGTINAYFGDDSYTEDGSNGQVMVYQPKFYYKVVPLKLEKIADGVGYHIRKANYYVSDTPHEGFKVHPVFFDQSGNEVEYVLFSAYEGSMWDASESAYFNDGTDTDTTIDTAADLICSVANVKPISGHKKPITKDNFETLSKNRGTGWHCDTIRSVSANQLLMLIELGTLNTQAVIGDGVVSIAIAGAYNCSSHTGSTAILGNTSGQATETINEIAGTKTTYSTAGKVSVTYRGIENPWGNIWKHINGINIWGDGSMRGGQPYVANDYNFNDSKHDDNYRGVGYTLPTTSGYISAMGYGCDDFDWLLIPTETSGTSTLPVGDYTNVGDNVNGYRTALLGAYWNNGGNAGGHSWHCSNPVGTSNRYIGGRLLFVPTATV